MSERPQSTAQELFDQAFEKFDELTGKIVDIDANLDVLNQNLDLIHEDFKLLIQTIEDTEKRRSEDRAYDARLRRERG